MTSETRGQNSWVNYGPKGEQNRTASGEDTIFADQKVGLMPRWTWTEGRAGDMEAPKRKKQLKPKILGVKPTVVIVNDEQKALVDQIKLEVRAQREQKKAYKQVLADISARVTALKSKGNISVKQFDAIMKNLKRLNFDNETKVQAFIDYVSRALANADYVEKVAKAQSLNKRIKASLKGTANPFAVLAKMFTTLDSRWVQNIDDHIAVAQMILDGVKPSTARRGVLTLKEEPDLQVIAEYIDAEQTLQTKMLLDNLKARYERITGKPADGLDAKAMLTILKDLNPTVDQTDKIKEQIDEKLAEYAEMLTDEDPQVIVDAINIDTDIMDWRDAVKVLDSLDTYFTNGSLAGIEALMGTYKGLENAKKFKDKSKPISVLGIKPLGRKRFKELVGFPAIMERKFRSQEKGLSYLKASGLNDIITGANRADYEASKKQLEYVKKFKKVKDFYSNENFYERGVIADLIRTNPGIDQDAEFERLVNILMASKDYLLEAQDKTKVEMGKLYDKIFKKLGLYDADANIESVKAKATKANLEAVNFVVDMFAEKYELLSDTAMSIYNTILGQDINYTPKTYLLRKMSEDDKFDMNDSGLSMYTNNFVMNEAGVLMPVTRPDDLKDRYVDLNFDNNMFRSYRLALTDAYTAKAIRQLNSFYNSKENEDIIGSEKDYNIIRGQISTYIKSIKGKNFVTQNEDRWANKLADILSTLGSVRALSGIVQFAQQFGSGMASTIIQAGEHIRPSDFTKEAFDFMNRSGQSIANVGENDILLSLTNLDKSIKRATVGKNMAEMSIEWYAEMNGKAFQVLVSNPDAAARRIAWMAYYRKYAVKNKLGPIDFNAEPNADAAAYAQSMVDRSMDATDARIRGDVYTTTNDAVKLLTRMFIPFSSFGMNQRTKMWGDIEKVFTGNANLDTARSLTSIIAEQAIYNTIRYYAAKYILIGVMKLLGYDDEEQEELIKELKKNIESSAWAKSIVDTVSPLALVDDYVLKIANDLMDWANIAEPDKKKVDDFIKEENDKRKLRKLDKLTPDQEMRKREEFIISNSMRFYISDDFSFGTMGIQAEKFSEMYEMQKALRTGSYTDDRGNEKYFDDKAKEKLASIMMLKSIAMGTPIREIDQIANKSFKLLKKGNTMSEKKNDMITEIKKNFGKLDPVLEKLAENKNKFTSIEAEIKWINSKKRPDGGYGLKGSKEKEEYAKLLDVISQPSADMLYMIQNGKTAQYIIDQELKK
jgi:adenylate kinase family enzyme